MRRLLLLAPVFLIFCRCEVLVNNSSGFYASACSGSNPYNLYKNHKVTGTISDVYDVYREFTNPNSSNTREEQKTTLKAELDLTITDEATSTVEGTAKVTWERHNKLVYRQNPGNCADGQNIDSNLRSWTVNIKGKFYCRDNKIGIQGSGTPDGSDIPTTLHYQDYGCPKTNCPPCYEATTSPKELVTWGSFDEHGFEANKLLLKTNMTPPAPFQGEWYREAILTIE